MPIFEYKCRACEHEYEALVLDAKTPPCPKCESQDIERRLSLFAVDSKGTRQLHLKAERLKNTKVQKDKAVAEHEETHHHHH